MQHSTANFSQRIAHSTKLSVTRHVVQWYDTFIHSEGERTG